MDDRVCRAIQDQADAVHIALRADPTMEEFPLPNLSVRRRAVFVLLSAGMGLIGLPALADEAADLARAVQLFEDGQYLEAQELLTGVDRSQLSTSKQATRDAVNS